MNTQEKAIMLANKALANPELLETLPEDIMFKFVIGIVLFDINLAIKLEELRPFTNSKNKVLFWEALGILIPQESFA
jgi:hypothetical protein